jgi:DNA primase
MPSPIALIKKSFPLANFVAPHTGGLKKSGRHFFIGHCPFHKSNNPKKLKFWVDTLHNRCGCFVPGCPAFANRKEDPQAKALDIIEFYALLRGLSNQEAIQELSRLAGGDGW